MANLDLKAHAAVQERVGHFYQDFPDGSIRTFLVRSDGPEVIFEARVYRSPESAAMGVYTSGWARVRGSPDGAAKQPLGRLRIERSVTSSCK